MGKETQSKLKTEVIAAEEMAKKQREISVAEFFEKNRHLLGFDNKKKALLTTIKEAVDNSLDACEEARILPELHVEIIEMSEERFRVVVEDNGPGIVKAQIPNIFAKLLYGSKFHTRVQSLTADELILIRENGTFKVIPIGEIVDKYIQFEDDFECNRLNLEVPCFDLTTYKYAFKKVSHLIKHKRQNEIYEITTSFGKSVKVTGCHSLFTVNKETLNVEEVEARKLVKGDIVLAPKKIKVDEKIEEINILDYINEDYSKKRNWYVYTEIAKIQNIFSKSLIIHKKKQKDKSRKYYRFFNNGNYLDVLDDSYKQYIAKGFIPVHILKFLSIKIDDGVIKTYQHGKEYRFPLVIPLTSSFMKLLGLFVAEGHTDSRQIGFTFNKNERDLVRIVSEAGFCLGVSHTIEERPEKNCVRVKLFGGVISHLFQNWCGKLAQNKKVPEFIFSARQDLRQDFIDYLYVGDGHNVPNRNQLVLSTVSKRLANEVQYLWLIQGVLSSFSQKKFKWPGKNLCICYVVSVYGNDIDVSNYFNVNVKTKRRNQDFNIALLSKYLKNNVSMEVITYMEVLKNLDVNKFYSKDEIGDIFNSEKIGYKLRFMLDNGFIEEKSSGYGISQKTLVLNENILKLQKLIESDFAFLQIKETKRRDEGYEYVYDISVPEGENFVGGLGGIACHNSRGQQGIGISAAAMYGQLTTGKPIRITSKISPKHPAHYMELHINTATNKPEISNEKEVNWNVEHGTKIELDLEALYQKGTQGVDEYIKQTAIVNPHCTIIYTNPKAEQMILTRVINELPPLPKPIKPHPYGLEIGTMFKMMKTTSAKTLNQFLQNDFSRVSSAVAKELCDNSGIAPNTKIIDLNMHHTEKLIKAISETKIMAPPTDCIFPIGQDLLEKGLRKEIPAEYYVAVTRPPQVYRGNPFVIECALAYGGELSAEEPAKIFRFANRVPLQYQQGACASNKAVIQTAWRSYGFNQSKGQLPQGPLVILIHIASVWAPFTSEAKEAIAHYPEIIKEMKLALQDAGRKLGSYVNRKKRAKDTREKLNLFESYMPEVAENLSILTGENKELLEKKLSELMEKQKEFIEKTEEMKVEHNEEDEEDKKYRIALKDEEEEE